MKKDCKRLPNRTKTARLTKKWAVAAIDVLEKLEAGLFASRKLDAPALNIPVGWVGEMRDRMTKVIADGNAWKEAERAKKNKLRRKRRKDGPYDPRLD